MSSLMEKDRIVSEGEVTDVKSIPPKKVESGEVIPGHHG